jgi:ribosomal protein S18 acetylase RimI-like enzyme
MIRQAKIFEIPDILRITKACAAHMAGFGIYQWNEQYPGQMVFENDLARHELFVLEKDALIIGCIVVSSLKDPEYKSVSWLTPDTGNLYIHRLAVHPDYQGKGYARQLMDFAEDMARTRGAISVRLDTFSRNKRNQKLYEQRGYHRLDDIYFPLQSNHPFHCYELLIQFATS